MWWPSPSDYQDTVQNPRLAFSDAALRDGEIVRDALGLPKPISGSFATVYQIDHAGRRYAVRCFLRHVPDISQRYASISAYLQRVALPSIVEFRFLEQGIRLRGQWFPVLKMNWLEGERLDVYVARHLYDSQALLDLARQFLQLAASLRQAKLAHGDLQHGNLLIVNQQLRLLDYDGMFVPELAGRVSNEIGQPNYQHPNRTARDYGPHLDNFSVWVITLSLLGLALDPGLRSSFSSGSEALLLKQSDFVNPSTSQVLTALQNSNHPTLRYLTLAFIPYLFAPSLDSIPAVEPSALAVVQAPTPAPAILPDWLRDTVSAQNASASTSLPSESASQSTGAGWLLDHLETGSPQRLSGTFRFEKFLLAFAALAFLGVVSLILLTTVTPLIGFSSLLLLTLATILMLGFGFSLRFNSPERRDALRSVHDLEETRLELKKKDQALTDERARITRAEQEEMAKLVKQQTANANQERAALAALDQTSQSELTSLKNKRQQIEEKRDAAFQAALERLRVERMERMLEAFRVADAVLPWIINRELKQALNRNGFVTAADITNFRVNPLKGESRFCLVNRRGAAIAVEGLSAERGVALILWRRAMEARAKKLLPNALPPELANQLGKRFQDELVNLQLAELKSKQQTQTKKAQLTESARKEKERLTRQMQDLPASYRKQAAETEQASIQTRKGIAESEWALVLARRRLQTFAHISFFNYLKSILGL
ncbi:MAG: hypothetical protein EYC68_07490 [Chloroflexota bacterium]|nr:MAG: hypothetical protein EYC68_07490 [Chloroflexota bacterium]